MKLRSNHELDSVINLALTIERVKWSTKKNAMFANRRKIALTASWKIAWNFHVNKWKSFYVGQGGKGVVNVQSWVICWKAERNISEANKTFPHSLIARISTFEDSEYHRVAILDDDSGSGLFRQKFSLWSFDKSFFVKGWEFVGYVGWVLRMSKDFY